ncbi:hypothetical protein ACFPTO_02095 [Paraburkholderia denitrificans]|uniref:Uncharacterized protein n=1 Tax=Paraburkholderia denitrificans TaxID=694025 RepID=A0ABW0J3K1_9BURK
MARIRTIKPDFWTDEKVVELSMPARLMVLGSLNFSDDNGNLDRSPKKLKMQVFPADAIDCEPLIQEVIAQGMLIEYSVSGKTYLHIKGFRKHQVINRPSKSNIPEPIFSDESCGAHGGLGDPSLTEGKGKEGKGKDKIQPTVDLTVDRSCADSQVASPAEHQVEQQGLWPEDDGEDAEGCTDEPGCLPPAEDDEPVKGVTEADIAKIFDYWRQTMDSPRSKLDDKRKRTIRNALKMGYPPRDLCRAIQGCALTPHNQGNNDRGQKYLGLHVCLGSADQIDRFVANSTAPPKAPEKKGDNVIPGWWNSDELAKQQAALVGVGGPLPSESRETWHARIRAAIDNGGKPLAPLAASVLKPAEPESLRVELTPEQKAERSAALLGALRKPPPDAVPVAAVPSSTSIGDWIANIS